LFIICLEPLDFQLMRECTLLYLFL
jgi:hypothetical protein